MDDPSAATKPSGPRPAAAPTRVAARNRPAPVKPASAPVPVQKSVAAEAAAAAAQQAPAEPNIDRESNAELRDFLKGKTVTEAVKSADGAFSVDAGTVIDEAVLDNAAAHDAILMLAVSVDA